MGFGHSIDGIDDHPLAVMVLLVALGGGIAVAGLGLADAPLTVAGILLALVGAWVSLADLLSRRFRSVTDRELLENEIIVRAHDADRLGSLDAADARARLDELVADTGVAAAAFHECVRSAEDDPAHAGRWLCAAREIEDALRRHSPARRRSG